MGPTRTGAAALSRTTCKHLAFEFTEILRLTAILGESLKTPLVHH